MSGCDRRRERRGVGRVAASVLPLAALLSGCAGVDAGEPVHVPFAPAVDGHVHVLSPAGAQRMRERLGEDGALVGLTRDAAGVVAMLDAAGVRKALIISEGYAFGNDELGGAGELAAVRRENDWAASQAALAPERLVAFCSLSALRPYALEEVERCATELGLRGVKLEFASSGFDLRDERHLARLREVLGAAERLDLTVLAHIRGWSDTFGAEEARILVERVLPAAPGVRLQIAHMGGWGGYDDTTDAVLGVFAAAIASGEIAGERIVFDLATVLLCPDAELDLPGRETGENDCRSSAVRLAARIEQLGPERVIFGSDWPLLDARDYAATIEASFGARRDLLRRVAANVPEHLR